MTTSRNHYGHTIFSDKRSGHLHRIAHHASDHDLPEWGLEALGKPLAENEVLDSRWLHLHFHMARFEIDTGRWEAALQRFRRFYIPAILRGSDVLTDAPALLWWVTLSTPYPVELPWGVVHSMALRAVHQPLDPFVRMHQLLAFAGAKDARALKACIARLTTTATVADRTLRSTATALLALAEGAWRPAADRITRLMPEILSLGGSHAQQSLFTALWRYCEEQANCHDGSQQRVA